LSLIEENEEKVMPMEGLILSSAKIILIKRKILKVHRKREC